MNLSRHEQGQLYIAVAAAVHGKLVNKGRSRPLYTARMAREHALAAVEVSRINSLRNGRSAQGK